MTRETLYEVLGDLREEYIQDANRTGTGRRHGRIAGSILAACLCAALVMGALIFFPAEDVVASPGFLTITAHATASDQEITMQEGMELPVAYNWSPAMSSRPGLPLELSAAEYPHASFDVSVDGGALLLWEDSHITYQVSPVTVQNGTTLYWTSLSQTGEDLWEEYTGRIAYIHIVIRQEGAIIGFAVVQIYADSPENDPVQNYCAKLLKSVSFPLVNGTYQRISDEYVAAEMERIQQAACGAGG